MTVAPAMVRTISSSAGELCRIYRRHAVGSNPVTSTFDMLFPSLFQCPFPESAFVTMRHNVQASRDLRPKPGGLGIATSQRPPRWSRWFRRDSRRRGPSVRTPSAAMVAASNISPRELCATVAGKCYRTTARRGPLWLIVVSFQCERVAVTRLFRHWLSHGNIKTATT